jgi:hypothetical protein
MTTPIVVVELWDRHADAFLEAPVYSPIQGQHIEEFERDWRPQFATRAASVRTADEERAAQLQDDHWNWRALAAGSSGRLDRISYAVECERHLQGMMIIDLTKRARLSAQAGQHLVYVDRLVTAPHNRIGFSSQPRFKGVGRVLMTLAVQVSLDEGFQGRVGLHALHQAEEFYRRSCEMEDLGPDPQYQDLRYFEMTPDIAKRMMT